MKRLSASARPRYDWKPDLPDHRDYAFAKLPQVTPPVRPTKVDLSSGMPLVFDQGNLGSCTGNAMAGAFAYAHQGVVVSRLMAYYNARLIEGTVKEDSGAQLRDVVKGMNKTGSCAETSWRYLVSKFATKPSVSCYTEAKKHRITQYARLSTLDDMLNCLAGGEPFIFGFSVYDSFESNTVARTGVVNLPQANEQLLGGHAVCAVGYDMASQRFKVRNSWGAGWGQKGYFTMPFAYLTDRNLSDDFWVIRL